MRLVVAFITLLGSWSAGAVTITASSAFDTRCFAPFLKQAMADWNFDTATAINFNLRQYAAAGDDTVTLSPVCNDVNPAITISAGSLPTGTSLTTTNLNDAKISGTPSSTGAVSFTISYDNDVGAAVTDAVAGTITASGGTGTPIANGTAGGGARFVDCNASVGGGGSGNDLLDGQTPGTPWGTLTKAMNTIPGLSAGTDLWLKAGSNCGQVLAVNWSGTSSDAVIVGTYYVSGGVAFQSVPDNVQLNPKSRSYTNGRATLRGSYVASCRVWPSQCNFNRPQDPITEVSVPTHYYNYMVTITGQYVTVQDLIVRDSAGGGINMIRGYSTCFHGNTPCESYDIVKDNYVSHTAGSAISFVWSRYGVVSGNEVDYQGIAWVDGQILNTGTGVAIETANCDPCSLLIENNYTHDIVGETISPVGGSFVLMRGNYTANQSRANFYIDGDADMMVEQNINAGGAYTAEAGLGSPSWAASVANPAFYSTSEIKEPDASSGGAALQQSRRIVYRNNLIANYVNAFHIGTDSGTTARFSGEWVGNTAIGASGQTAVSQSDITNAMMDAAGFHLRDNILATTTGAPGCQFVPAPLISLDHNYWVNTPADTDCRGTGDIYSTYAALLLPAFNFATADKSSFPAESDFLPGSGSSATMTTTQLTSAYFTASDWTWVLGQRVWKPACYGGTLIDAAHWVDLLYEDYCGNVRDGTWVGARKPTP